MKNIFLLISVFLILGCSPNNYTFLNDDLKNELDNFLNEYKEEKLNGVNILIIIADAKYVFQDYDYEKDKNRIFLTFYLSPPETCDGFYANFYYKGKNIMLYEYSDRVKLSQFIEIKPNNKKCESEILIDYIDNPYQRWFLIEDNLKLTRFPD